MSRARGRVRLVAATVESIDAELRSSDALEALVGARLARDWPPEFHTSETLARTREALEQPGADGWWMHLFVRIDVKPNVIVGFGGFKGPPSDDGQVEIGYSVVPSAQGKDLATEAAGALVDAAFARGATSVRAETLPSLPASIAVLAKLGFRPADPSQDGVLAFELQRPAG